MPLDHARINNRFVRRRQALPRPVQHAIIGLAPRCVTLMCSPRRIPFSLGASIFALASFPLWAMSNGAIGRGPSPRWVAPFRVSSEIRLSIEGVSAHLATSQAGQATGVGTAPTAPAPPRAADEAWNDSAGSLAAKIMEHVTAGNALALTVKNASSLGDDDVFRVRRALRTQLRSQHARLAAGKQAKVDVQVTLSENAEGYLWIAELHDHSLPSAAGGEVRTAVVMVSVARPRAEDRRSPAEPLSIRKVRIYEQAAPLLDVAMLDSPSGGQADANTHTPAARILVLSLDSVSVYEKGQGLDSTGKNSPSWRLVQSAAMTRVRPWPRDARGRIVVHGDSVFEAYLPETKCTGSLAPALTFECHDSDDPWPLVLADRTATPSEPVAEAGPAAYFTPDRNFFDGRIKLDDGSEVRTTPFSTLVIMTAKGAAHAGLPAPGGRVPPGATAIPGWVLGGLDGGAQLLAGNLQPVANVGGWGSQMVGLQSGCGSGWQILATQARDLNQADAVQGYEITDRKPVPVSSAAEFAGPVMELWPMADGSQAIAISRNLQTAAYEAFRLSILCSE